MKYLENTLKNQTSVRIIFIWKRLSTGTVPVNKKHLTGTVPANKEHLTGTVPVNKEHLTCTLSKVLAGHASGCWLSALGAGMLYNREKKESLVHTPLPAYIPLC